MAATSKPAADGMEVTLRVADTDQQFRLLFSEENGCWTLVRKSDDSLQARRAGGLRLAVLVHDFAAVNIGADRIERTAGRELRMLGGGE